MNKDLSYLNDNKYFDVNGFLNYINNEYPESNSVQVKMVSAIDQRK